METKIQRSDRYLQTRFRPDPRRDAAWQHIADYLSRWWTPDAAIVDVGAGYCSFINVVRSRRRVAVDVHDRLAEFAAPGVETRRASATDLSILDSGSFDIVFASNLLEHLDRRQIDDAVAEFRRLLTPSGRLILIQPNYRLCASEYFDDYTHVTPLSDRSLSDLLAASGFQILLVEPRFLPLTVRSRAARLTFLVPLYLRSPWRPLAAQMLLVAQPTPG